MFSPIRWEEVPCSGVYIMSSSNKNNTIHLVRRKKKGRGEKPEHVSLRDDNNGKALEAKGKKKISGFVARNVGSALEG